MVITPNWKVEQIRQQAEEQLKKAGVPLSNFDKNMMVCKSVEEQYKLYWNISKNIFNKKQQFIDLCELIIKELNEIKATDFKDVSCKERETLLEMSKFIEELYEG